MSKTRRSSTIDGITLTRLVRENLAVLTDLAQCYEVDRQIEPREHLVVRNPAEVAAYLGAEMADLAQEQLRVLLLDVKNGLIGTSLVYQGGANAIVIRLADCFREAVRSGAAAIVLVHNHPSHDPTPSEEDARVTREAAQVGDLLGIALLDHVVLGGRGDFVSLRERGYYRPVSGLSPTKGSASGCCQPTWEMNRA